MTVAAVAQQRMGVMEEMLRTCPVRLNLLLQFSDGISKAFWDGGQHGGHLCLWSSLVFSSPCDGMNCCQSITKSVDAGLPLTPSRTKKVLQGPRMDVMHVTSHFKGINQGKQDNCSMVMIIWQEISFQVKTLSGC